MRQPLKDFSIIYKITCKTSDLCYVGQTRDFDRRQKEYKREYITKNNYLFYKDMRQFGIENFTFEILETCKIEEASLKEKFWIQELNTHIPNGYNISIGGNTWAWKNPEETKRKISEKAKGRIPNEETRAIWRKNRSGENNSKAKLTAEDVKNIREQYVPHKVTVKMLSKKFNVSIVTIQRIVNNRAWKI